MAQASEAASPDPSRGFLWLTLTKKNQRDAVRAQLSANQLTSQAMRRPENVGSKRACKAEHFFRLADWQCVAHTDCFQGACFQVSARGSAEQPQMLVAIAASQANPRQHGARPDLVGGSR